MATRTVAVVDNDFPNCFTATWTGLLQSSSDVGEALEYPHMSDKTVQLSGTLGTGGAITMQGSNDGTNWASLTDPQGNAIVLSAIGAMEQIMECPRYIRPNVTAGNGTTNLTVIVQMTKGSR